MGLCKSLRWSLLWICILASFIAAVTEGANVRRVYRRNGNYGRRISAPQISSVLQTPSRVFRVHEPFFEASETRRVGSVIPRPSNQLRLPAVDRQDQLAEETESSAGYSYATPEEKTTGKPGYSYKRPSPIAEYPEPDNTEEDVYTNETPDDINPDREAEIPDQLPAFGVISNQEVDAEGVEPDSRPQPVKDNPIAEFSDTDSKCNENDHDCWPHGYKGVIRGEAGTDYPILTEIIPTSFDCNNVQYSGYYADTDETARCQIFHICLRRNRHRKTQKWSFLCPNGTVFDQGNFVCVWWDMAPECNKQTVEPLYDLNAALGWDNITETEFDVNSVMNAMGDSQMSRNFEEQAFQQSSSRLKNTIVEKPRTTKRPPVVRMRVKSKTPASQSQQQSRNSAYRIPVRVSDGARDRTALKPVTNSIGDSVDTEHDTGESSTYETSLRTEQHLEARHKTKSASALHKSQSEAYEEKSEPESLSPYIVNNRRPYVDRDEATTESYDEKVPVVVMMPTQQRYPDGSEGIVNVPVIIMKSKQRIPSYSEDNESATPDSRYLPPSKTTEEYDPVEQPLPASTSAPQYLPPVTEVVPPTTEEAQYDQEIDQQSPQPVYVEEETEEEPNPDIEVGYRYPKPPRQIVKETAAVEVTTTEASGYGYRRPTTTAEPVYAQQLEETTTDRGYKYRRPTTTAEPVYEEQSTTEEQGYRYRRPTTREPEEQELSTQNIIQEYSTTERSREYLPPKQETTVSPAGAYLPPKEQTTESPPGTYLPPKQETAETSTAGYLPPRRESTTKSPAGAYLPPKQEQITERIVEATEIPTTQEARTTTSAAPNTYLPPKNQEEQTTTESASNAYLPPKKPEEARTTTEASSSNAYLPPKAQDQETNSNRISTDTNSSPVTGRAITQKVSSEYVPKADENIVLPGVDTKESSEETELTDEQSSEEANEVTNPAKEDITEKYHLPTPSTPVVTPDSEDLGTPSQLYNANVRQQLYAKNKNGKPGGYEENVQSQEKINEIIRQLQAGVAEAEDSNGKKIDFAQFAKINAKIALVVPERGTNGTSQTAQTLIFDSSTESVTEALKSIPSSVSPSLVSPSPSSESLPYLETYIQNPFKNQDFTSINTPQYEIKLPTKEFESHSVENSIDYERKQNQGNQQQFSAQFEVQNNNFPQIQVQQPQISNFIQPQPSPQIPNQVIQHPVLSTVLYSQPPPQPTQNFIVPITSPPQQQFNPQQLFFQTQTQPQPQQLQEPVYTPPLPPPVSQQQQNFVQQSPPQQNYIPQQNFVQQAQPQQNFVQQSQPQQNFVQQSQPQQNFVQQPAPQQNFVQQQSPQQNFVQRIPERNNFVQQTSQQQNFIQQQPHENNNNNYRAPQQDVFRSQQQQQQPEVFRAPTRQEPEIIRAPLQQQQQNFQQQTIFNQQQAQQPQIQSDNRYLPPEPQNFPRQNLFRQQPQQFQHLQSQATYNRPQIVDFTPAKTPTLETISTKTPKKLINPADIKIVPAIFVHHHTRVENPDGSPIQDDNPSTEQNNQQQPESRPRQQQSFQNNQQSESRPRQQQSFQNSGYYEAPQQSLNKFRNSNYLSFSAQQTEHVPVAVSAPQKQTRPSLPPPPSPSNVFSPQKGIAAPQIEKFTLDDARTVDQLQPYHRENLKTFVPVKPTQQNAELTSTSFIGTGSSGRLDLSPEQSSIAEASRFYPGRDNSLGVKLTYE